MISNAIGRRYDGPVVNLQDGAANGLLDVSWCVGGPFGVLSKWRRWKKMRSSVMRRTWLKVVEVRPRVGE